MSGRRSNGSGTVYRRKDGRWVARAYLLMPDGTYRRRDTYTRSEASANKKLIEMLSNSHRGIPAEATGWKLADFLNYWLEHIVQPARKPKTYQGYEVVVRVHLIPELGKRRLSRLSVVDVRLLLQRLRNRCLCCLHGYDEHRPLKERRCCAVGKCCRRLASERLVQQVHAVLKNALQAAVREELISRNVAKLVQQPDTSYRLGRGINVEQARRLRAAAKGDRFYALYVLALYLGLRRGELLGLRWDDVDLDRGSIEITGALQRVGGELRRVSPKTRTSRRTVPLVGICQDALTEHRKLQDDERALAGDTWVDTSYVFTTARGTPIEPDNLRRSWYPIREAASLGEMRFHDLRHSCVTLLLDLGVAPHIVRDIVGHSTLDVTMGIYAHASLDEKRRALRALDKRLQ